MKNKLKAAAAAVTAFALLGSALPVNFAGVQLLRPAVTANAYETVSFDEESEILTLHGNVDKQEVQDAILDLTMNIHLFGIKVNCEEGTVLPVDSSYLFAVMAGDPKVIGITDEGPIESDDPDDIDWYSIVKEFDLRNADTSHVTDMKDMFRGNMWCESILMDFDTSHVTNMNGMFKYCKYSLLELDLSGFDMSSVTDASELFYMCEELKTIYAGRGWNVNPEATDCTKMFYDCPKLISGLGTEWSKFYINGECACIDTTEPRLSDLQSKR